MIRLIKRRHQSREGIKADLTEKKGKNIEYAQCNLHTAIFSCPQSNRDPPMRQCKLAVSGKHCPVPSL